MNRITFFSFFFSISCIFILFGCKQKQEEPVAPTFTSGKTFTLKMDGNEWTATSVQAKITFSGSVIQITGIKNTEKFILEVTNKIGTFQAVNSASYDATECEYYPNTAGSTTYYQEKYNNFTTTVSSLTNSNVKGTFSGTLQYGGSSNYYITEGKFDIDF